MTTRPPRASLEAHLEQELLSGRFKPGEKLPSERILAETYSVSRPIVREVLRSLQERRLVDVIAGRGTFARAARTTDGARSLDAFFRRRQVTPRELTDARIMVESVTAAAAARLATDEEIASLLATLERFDKATNVVDKARADIAFHAAIARMARNPVIEAMFASVSGLAFELMLRSLSDPHVAREGVPFHDDIFTAIKEHDPEGARQAMLGHLSVARRTYGADYDKSLDDIVHRELGKLIPAVDLDHLLNEIFDEVSP
ncbi:FadR/GntR family transcriptional regulator [Micromonospora sp. CPCC 206061]|uniref:FadR/GntR family transcriptional regulator n=1 Tax=Micromonospora sp. CPCC 206061 TaxID=3122410 RepID=UPI002FF3D6F0